MSEPKRATIGSIGWIDLTTADADGIRDFYAAVVGWGVEAVPMGDYHDYSMSGADGQARAGVCHARGANTGLPAAWIMYVIVENLDRSVARCTELGGTVIAPTRAMGNARYCVIQDPAGAVVALYQEN